MRDTGACTDTAHLEIRTDILPHEVIVTVTKKQTPQKRPIPLFNLFRKRLFLVMTPHNSYRQVANTDSSDAV